MSHYQLLVIGAGPGGYSAALRAAALGLHTAVVEQREVGGTCLNRGCIPTKALLHASQIYHDAVEGERLGIRATGAAVDLPAMFAYKNAVSEKLRGGIESLLKSGGVDLLRGRALITAPGTVEVTDGEGEKTVYTADSILAATGSVPSRPPVPGLTLPGVVTSDELLAGGERLYRSVVIIGGGVIGVEFAAFYSDLGCHVTVIEGMDRLLPTMDRELGQNLAQILKKQGVEVCTSAPVQCGRTAGLLHPEGRAADRHRGSRPLRHRPQAVLGGAFRPRPCAGDRRPPPVGGRSVPHQRPHGVRHRRRLLPGGAGPCGRRSGRGLCQHDGRARQ